MEEHLAEKKCKMVVTNDGGMGMFGFTLRQRFKPQNCTINLGGVKLGEAEVKVTFISRPKSTGIWYIGSDITLPVNTTNDVFKSSPIAYNKELKLYAVSLNFTMDE